MTGVGPDRPHLTDGGTAVVEFLLLGVLLLVPLLYLALAASSAQRSMYGVTQAAREAGRAYATGSAATAADRADYAAALALADQGLPVSGVTVRYGAADRSCDTATGDPWPLTPGAVFAVCVTRRFEVPAVPGALVGRNTTVTGRYVVRADPHRDYTTGITSAATTSDSATRTGATTDGATAVRPAGPAATAPTAAGATAPAGFRATAATDVGRARGGSGVGGEAGMRSRHDRGSITPLVVGAVLVAGLLVTATIAASAAFLAHRDLAGLCDGAAVAAAAAATTPDPDGVPRLDPARVAAEIERYRTEADPRERNDRADPRERTDRADPPDPTDRADPPDPTDRADPPDPTDRADPPDPTDRADRADAAGRADAGDRAEADTADPSLVLEAGTDGRTVTVVCSRRVEIPFGAVLGAPHGLDRTVVARARPLTR